MVEFARPLAALNADSCFAVADVLRTVAFYCDVLGFESLGLWGDPPRFSVVRRGSLEVFLTQLPEALRARPDDRAERARRDAYLRVPDLDDLGRQLVTRGARILRGPETAFYGVRELDVEDCDGHVLCFAQESAPSPSRQPAD